MGPPFSISMEWSGRQQLWFLLQSVGLGYVEGLLLDTLTSFIPSVRRCDYLWTDVAFGPFAAVVTFFGALAIMDGQLHPLLLFGVFLGMLIEHVSLGILLHKIVLKTRKRCDKMCRFLIQSSECLKKVRIRDKKSFKKVENNEKSASFFKKRLEIGFKNK